MQNKLLHAAFMMEGLHEAGYDACIKTWDQGCIELVSALVAYAPYAESLIAAAQSIGQDNFPGVFDYEVSSPFGKWFGEHLLYNGDVPSEDTAKEWLRNAVVVFFSQGLNKESHEALEKRLQGAINQHSSDDVLPVARWDAYNEGNPTE